MANFQLRWANRSNSQSTQDWQISNGDDFQLQYNYVRSVNVTINSNYTFHIAASVGTNRFAAASLTYTTATQTWILNSHTPNEWELATGNNNVTVRCLLGTGQETEEVPAYEVEREAEEMIESSQEYS